MNGEEIKYEQKESVKLSKMSKGYNWEIRLVGDLNESQLKRLEILNEMMRLKYGTE